VYLGAHGYKVPVNPNNPFGICTIQEKKELISYCYERVLPQLFESLHYDISAAGRYILSIPDTEIRSNLAAILGHEELQLRFSGTDYDVTVPTLECRKIDPVLQDSCFQGMVYDLFYNIKGWGSALADFSCDPGRFTDREAQICRTQKQSVLTGRNQNE
jgi:hypothetical protein